MENEKRYVTYRIGENRHHPRDRQGTEIDERTALNMESFIAQTESLIGKKISIIWMGSVPMPGPSDWTMEEVIHV